MTERRWPRFLLGAAAVFAAAALVRWTGLGQEATHDEIFHVLAGRSWLHDRTLALGDGIYGRAAVYTKLVAATMGAFGETLVVARLPSLVAGSLLAAAVFGLLADRGETAAAWIAGGLVVLDPTLVESSQMVRFYALQNLLFFLGAAAVLAALAPGRRGGARVAYGAAALALLWLGTRLQTVTMIGAAGLCLAAPALVWRDRDRLLPRIPEAALRRVLVGGLLLAGAAGAAFVAWGPGGAYLDAATRPDFWALGRAGALDYYYALLYDDYAPALALLPLLLLLAAARRTRLTLWAGVVFLFGFAVHSVLPWKGDRYLGYLLPLFFLVVALGAVEGVERLRPALRGILGSLLPARGRETAAGRRGAGETGPGRAGPGRAVVVAALAAVVVFAAGAHRAFLQTYRLMTRDHAYTYPFKGPRERPISWERAVGSLGATVDTVSALVSRDDVKALYYAGRLDYSMHPSSLYGGESFKPEFTVDPRTGRPVVTRPESLARIMACHPSGLVLVEASALGNPRAVLPEMRTFLEELRPLPMPRRAGILAYSWHRPGQAPPGGCDLARPRDPAAGGGT